MEYGIIIAFWFLAFLMITGTLIILIYEDEFKKTREDDDYEKYQMIELFLHIYYSQDFGGRLEFIIVQGATFWGAVLSIIINAIKKQIKKGVYRMAIFLITGASGSGKTKIAQFLQGQGLWNECISTTTRPMRKKDGEINGKTYYFVSLQEFKEIDSIDGFAEKVKYDSHYYGVTKKEIERVKENNSHIFIIVEYEGYKQLKEIYPDAIGIFLYMSKEDCMANMLLRGDSLENATKRISKYDEEMSNRNAYDYVVKNVRGKMSQTAEVIKYIVEQY